MKTKIFFLLLICLMGTSVITSFENDKTLVASTDQTVTQYVESDNNFSILVQTLTKANLADVLNGQGNFTVFAPDNDAM